MPPPDKPNMSEAPTFITMQSVPSPERSESGSDTMSVDVHDAPVRSNVPNSERAVDVKEWRRRPDDSLPIFMMSCSFDGVIYDRQGGYGSALAGLKGVSEARSKSK